MCQRAVHVSKSTRYVNGRSMCQKERPHERNSMYTILTAIVLFFCWLFSFRNGIFGSDIDWISQHSVIPDYFRQLFYDTGNLFPEFAANIGGGQNIYNFSYYGLYSPVILISYLFPSVKMGTYLMVSMVVSLIAAVLLLYRWLQKRGISRFVSFMTALMFLLAGPMIYHSYNQLMFVNYMPFLCLALIGVDRYFDENKEGLYTVSVWLMIMTSFYFGIGGMLVLVIYGIYRYMGSEGKKNVKTFLLEGIRFLIPMLVAVLMSAVLLVPTAYVLMGGRSSGTKAAVSLGELFSPHINIGEFLYSPYGIGLAALVIVVLIAGIFYKKGNERWLHIACILVLVIPVFAWALNGGLYIRNKVFVPFLPLLCYMIAAYIEKQRKEKIPFVTGLIPFVLTLLLLFTGRKTVYWVDGILMLGCFLICYKKKCMQYLILPSVLILCVQGFLYNNTSPTNVAPKYYNQVTDKTNRKEIDKIAKEENGFYRIEQNGDVKTDFADLNRIWSADQYISSIYSSVENPDYQNFRTQTFQVEQPYRNILMQARAHNAVFQRFMGVKYLLSDEAVPGYKKIGEKLYENKDVLPVAYYTSRVMPQTQYDTLQFPYNQLAFLSRAVVDTKEAGNTDTAFLDAGLKKIPVNIKTDAIGIESASEGDILFLQFQVENHSPKSDVAISVEGVRNKLSAENHIYYNGNTCFTYAVLLEEGQTGVAVSMGDGDYEISDLTGYLWKSAENKDLRSQLVEAEFILDKAATKGDIIKGSVDATADNGYLITSIPYDENFEVLVDGESAACEKVNTAFLGLKMDKGMHEVTIEYHAPGVLAGKILSITGLLLGVLAHFVIFQKRSRK